MKKFVIALVAILVVMSLTVMAQAEVRYEHFVEGTRYVGTDEEVDYYGVTIVSDSGDEVEIELTKEEFEELYNEYAVHASINIFGLRVMLP